MENRFNMTFETFKNVINNADFVQQWHYLTYANSKVFILLYPIIITYFGIKDFLRYIILECYIQLAKEQIIIRT